MICTFCGNDLVKEVRQYTFHDCPVCWDCHARITKNMSNPKFMMVNTCQSCNTSIGEGEEFHMEYGDDGHPDMYWHEDCWAKIVEENEAAHRSVREKDWMTSIAFQPEIEALEAKIVDYTIWTRENWDRDDEQYHRLYEEVNRAIDVLRLYHSPATELLQSFVHGWGWEKLVAGGYEF